MIIKASDITPENAEGVIRDIIDELTLSVHPTSEEAGIGMAIDIVAPLIAGYVMRKEELEAEAEEE